ncbi:hypothetical protein B0O80DRAFT_429364 [Mortierella sp. GBAus27b]|nr:hypothetical protein BGX31_003993 [Mortierella sp. GBA43]KAI8349017.1 hypothetical protein B0O80DRAFT_429364 [Mortierella sp. GBAus27b]
MPESEEISGTVDIGAKACLETECTQQAVDKVQMEHPCRHRKAYDEFEASKDAPPNAEPSTSDADPMYAPRGDVSPIKRTSILAGHKRLRDVKVQNALRKPFRSPLRLSLDSGTRVKHTPSETSASKKTPLEPNRTLLQAPFASKKPSLRVRRPFRSPLGHHTPQSPNDSPYDRLIQIQALQAQVVEIQSSIRKGQRVLHQQETSDTPLEDLIDKWRKASQEGAKMLLEKVVEREQLFGGGDDSWGDHVGPNAFSTTWPRQGFCLGTDNWDDMKDSAFERRRPNLSEMNPEQIQAMAEQMETQDHQLDLPTVDEALKSKLLPETAETPRTLTRMQKLLMGLGIDPALLGYNPEQDGFSTEESF